MSKPGAVEKHSPECSPRRAPRPVPARAAGGHFQMANRNSRCTSAIASKGKVTRPVVHKIDFQPDPTNYAYVHMANHIKKRIEAGELKFNKPLPAERRLAQEYGVSLGTARRATEELRSWGLVFTLRSKGTFVGRLLESPHQPVPPPA